MTTEAQVIAKVTRWCRAHGIKYQRMALQPGASRGFPDMVFLVPGGKPLLVEFKRPGKKPNKFQTHTLDQLKELGYAAFWSDDAAAVIQLLESTLDSPR